MNDFAKFGAHVADLMKVSKSDTVEVLAEYWEVLDELRGHGLSVAEAMYTLRAVSERMGLWDEMQRTFEPVEIESDA